MFISGWLLGGFGYTTPLGHPISTISFLLGLAFMIGGIAFLIITFSSKK